MKVFLLATTILLLISRIKSTPRMLSKTLYRANLSNELDKQKKAFEGEREDFVALVKGASVVMVLLCQAFVFVYYLLVGNRFSSNIMMLILTALQIVTIFITTTKMTLNTNAFSQNVDDHKFHRLYFLFNVVLDYIYYPMTIYLLLT